MKVIIAGSRDITDYDAVVQAVEDSGFEITQVISGGARGVDKLGERYANDYGLELAVFPADWNKNGKAAGDIRNAEMAVVGEALIAVRLNNSTGTTDMIKKMKNKGCPIYVVEYEQKSMTIPFDESLFD